MELPAGFLCCHLLRVGSQSKAWVRFWCIVEVLTAKRHLLSIGDKCR